jgi:hypothetical protein
MRLFKKWKFLECLKSEKKFSKKREKEKKLFFPIIIFLGSKIIKNNNII